MSRLRSGGDIAVDLGTANTVVYVRGRGIVLSEPSVVAIDQRTGEVHAVGADAQRMIGRTPATISADRPLRHGVIADFEVTEAMLRQFVDKVLHSRFSRPRMVICAPSGITEVERRAVEEATLSAGAREVHLIEESLAAAIGAGIDISEPVGRMVVDVGGGTSEVADHLPRRPRRRALAAHRRLRPRRRDHDAHSSRAPDGDRLADRRGDQARRGLGTPLAEEIETSIRGRDLPSGLPREIVLTSEEVRQAIAAPLAEIMTAIHATLEETPPELAADITTEGILLAGGGSLLRGFDERVGRETGMPVRLADDPLACVATGRRHVAGGARHAPRGRRHRR